MQRTPIILGIESSCDETAAALYGEAGLLAHAVHSQVAIHADYGGVVPELASRDHIRKIAPLIENVCATAGHPTITGIAYTRGPGLVGALLVGASVAAGYGMGLSVPVLGVHHMEGHLLSPLLEAEPPAFPYVALLVSGGHTMLVAVEGVGRYRVLGESLDDAVGEAFDKAAKMLGLGYPGGPALSRLAAEGDPTAHAFPRPMCNRPGLDFSFSGLKTAVMLAIKSGGRTRAAQADIAASFQQAVVETLVAKCARAVRAAGMERLVVAGGVGANASLRAALAERGRVDGFALYFPRPAFCTDNAAMIALTGYLRRTQMRPGIVPAEAVPRWSLETLVPPASAAAS
ncbi:tRNA (adenosine(37)-N6)-threonylcarbamoyltransferase complex transferase subunit TsaD [Salinisphaera sp. Q1T1-3]|uniref:tRNA (adenosine(37)-N6)-threonylcarbamoyltransferase complex transferase subunit TsaD n=1 Tax=Salinisphaera sp. Q1T1-3 TaxID=2321229 RepID=UPI000E748CE0|nr:tRNA (adenosine(37)-N6)-threonylcarbamoyltransferase complex transferase subunit TsaD [Salinisphaera sp. Q1T1-3]RJS91268.1 tRNA (adenosine(37)-N6)-threonylcarbamoyltransferase complex transferase subunit TsaD [Salinisphaera sp. Q1T1-3]